MDIYLIYFTPDGGIYYARSAEIAESYFDEICYPAKTDEEIIKGYLENNQGKNKNAIFVNIKPTNEVMTTSLYPIIEGLFVDPHNISVDSNRIKSENEFNQLMEEIDADLRIKNVPIYNRPIHALLAMSRKINLEIIFPPSERPIPGVYTGNNLSAHMNIWFEKRYGNRLKSFMGAGYGIIIIKNEPWKVIFPTIFGSVYFICDPNISKYKDQPSLSTTGKPPIINILNLIEDFPETLAQSLTPQEIREIKQTYLSCLQSISYLKMIKEEHLVSEAKADLEMAISNLIAHPPHYGISKWSSLQFSEKLFKSYIASKSGSGSYPHHHDLSELNRIAMELGLPQIPETMIDQVQCVAGVRYGTPGVTLEEAVIAHHSSLGICFFIAKAISNR